MYSQLGRTDEARATLLKASKVGSDEQIRVSALQMLASLPAAK
ncbi:MAG: hypothetical protein ABI661_08160 [Gammaproteobacteria bacterium]